MKNKFILPFCVVLTLFVCCNSPVVENVSELQDEVQLEVEDDTLSFQKRFNKMLNNVYEDLFNNSILGEDLIVIPIINQGSVQSIALVKGIYKPITEYEFSGYADFNERRVIFLNLDASIYNIINKSILNDSLYIYTMDELGLGSYNPIYRYVTIYSFDSLVLSDVPIIGGASPLHD